MPFKSDSQRKLCYLLKSKGQAGSWDCDEWSTATGKKKLPEHVKKQEEKKASNVLVGGAGDNKKPSDFPKDVLYPAVEHELEHTNDRKVAEEIAIDHLTEDVDYYKKLKKVEGDKEATMRKLARLWSLPAKISKLAEVTTSPNRGAGDKEEGIVNFDSSEGIDHAFHKEPRKGPALSLTPVDSHPKPYLARKALIGATKKTFGTNPTGGSILNKMAEGLSYPQQVYNNFANPIKSVGQFGSAFHDIANNIDDSNKSREMIYRQQAQLNKLNKDRAAPVTSSPAPAPNRNFDFSSIGQRLDPSIIGAPNNQAAAKPVNPVSQLSSTLKQVGSAMGDRVSGAVRKGAEDWVKSPGFANPREVYRRRNQALDTQKQLGKSVGDMAGAFKQTASGARAIGNAIPGMAKQSSGLMDTARNVGAGASGAGGALYNAFSGATGNQQSYDALKNQAAGPDLAKTWEGVRGAAGDIGNTFSQIGQNAKNMAPGVLRGVTSLPGLKDVQVPIPESMNPIPAPTGIFGGLSKYRPTSVPVGYAGGVAADKLKQYMNQPSSVQPGVLSKATTGLYNQLPANMQQNLSSMGDAFKGFTNAAGQHVTNQAINYEAGRRTAGYALPVVDWMRANPWAKYMLGAGAGLLGGYALRNLFGDGGDGQQAQGNPVESAMAQGYQQQAMHQMPSNYGNMYGMRG